MRENGVKVRNGEEEFSIIEAAKLCLMENDEWRAIKQASGAE